MRGHLLRECSRLDAGTKSLLTKAFLKRCKERLKKEEKLRQGQPVAAVSEHYGPSWSFLDDSPSTRRDEAKQDAEDNSPSEKKKRSG